MALLEKLPTETLLLVLSYLSLWDVSNLKLLSRGWRDLIECNEESLYYQLSSFHGLIPSTKFSPKDAIMSLPNPRPQEISWKSFCKSDFVQRAG
jgi:hypothetical protein